VFLKLVWLKVTIAITRIRISDSTVVRITLYTLPVCSSVGVATGYGLDSPGIESR
jgi:hypothetical protein